MKVVSWNCNKAFRKKFEVVAALDADVLVVQECEDPERVICRKYGAAYKAWASNYLWVGDNKNSGVGVFAKAGICLESLDWGNVFDGHEVRHFLPCRVDGWLDLLGVWNHKNNSPNFGYIGQFWKYLQLNREVIGAGDVLVVGDFNSNAMWDEWDRWWNHSDVVRELGDIGIMSLYHLFCSEVQGQESKSTFYMYKRANRGYHIDYCFGSRVLQEKLVNFEVEGFRGWQEVSDHVPIVMVFDV